MNKAQSQVAIASPEKPKSSKTNEPLWLEVDINTLKLAEYNPRNISPHKLEMLKKSITEEPEFLRIRPLIVNQYPGRENIVIGGNMRLIASKELGFERIPVVYVSVDPIKEKVWNLKDNAGYGVWENELLKEVVLELRDEEVDLELTGFDSAEIAAILGEEPPVTEMDEDEEEFTEPAKETTYKRGDIIKVGNHTIMCGDSTSKDDVDKLFAAAETDKARVLVTSPPYGVGIEYEERGEDPLMKLITGFIGAYSERANTQVINFANIRCATDGWQFDTFGYTTKTMAENKFHLLDTRIWVKPRNYGTAPYWLHTYKSIDDWEFINIYQREKDYVNRLSKAENDDWGYDGVWKMENSSGDSKESSHPAKFPVILPFRSIQMLSDEGDYVVDPFGGAMTTLLACEKLGRKAIMMEYDPFYIEAAIGRIQKHFPDIEVTKL